MTRYVFGAAALALLVAAGIGWAAIPSSGESAVISGCYAKATGLLRVIDVQAGKTCTKWELPISWSERGPQGAQGVAGPQGEQGPPGAQGPVGPQGKTGDKGDPGAQGVAGPAGPTGDTGPQGIQGVKGDQGPQGATGPEGAKGDSGAVGATGPAGPAGSAAAWTKESYGLTPVGGGSTIVGSISLPSGKYVVTASGTVSAYGRAQVRCYLHESGPGSPEGQWLDLEGSGRRESFETTTAFELVNGSGPDVFLSCEKSVAAGADDRVHVDPVSFTAVMVADVLPAG